MPRLPLYLASASPRRHELLAQAGIRYEPFMVPIDEDSLSAEYTGPLLSLGEYLARHKALAAQQALLAGNCAGLVLASDTTVLLHDRSLAKPRGPEEARAMLRALRGREHTVATGVALAGPESGELVSATSTTTVLMRNYSDEEIEAYIATGDPLDKAGAYSIQHPAFQPVASISGCYLGVVGLPVCLVAALMRDDPQRAQDGAHDLSVSPGCAWSTRCVPPFPHPHATYFPRDHRADMQ